MMGPYIREIDSDARAVNGGEIVPANRTGWEEVGMRNATVPTVRATRHRTTVHVAHDDESPGPAKNTER